MKFKKLIILGIALSSTMLIPTSVSASSYYSNSAYAEAFSKHYGNMCVITTDQLNGMNDVNGEKAVNWVQKASAYRSTHYIWGGTPSPSTHVKSSDMSPNVFPGRSANFGLGSGNSNLSPNSALQATIASPGHDANWTNRMNKGDTMALGITHTSNGTFIQGKAIEHDAEIDDGGNIGTYRSSSCAGNGVNQMAATWKNTGGIIREEAGKSHKPNSTYYDNYYQKQVLSSDSSKTRKIRTDYKKGTYDANGHTKTWENWDYDKNGNWTYKTVTEYKYNPSTKKEVVSKVTKYKNVNGKAKVTSTKVTPTTWTTNKTYSKVSGKAHKANGTYIKETRKKQTSNFGKTQDIRTDYVKGTYGSNGKTKTWENWDYNSAGKFTAKKVTKYDSKERVINNTNYKYKTPGNSKTAVHTYYKNTKYHSNGRVKSTSTYSYYANSNQASKNVWNEFYTNGKPKLYKDTYYKSNGNVKEVRHSKFSTAGKRSKSIKKY